MTSQLTRRGTKWSKQSWKCRGCGTKTRPHVAKGFCSDCYEARRDERYRRLKRLRERERYWRARVELLEKRWRSDQMTRTTEHPCRKAEAALDRALKAVAEGRAEFL